MLLQTNSYIVPKDKRAQHTRLVQRFRQTLTRLGCDHFEAYEQVGANWSPADTTGRFVQLMRFRDRKHQLAVQGAERADPTAQGLIKEFCELINFPYQQQQGLFAVGFYHSLLPPITPRSAAPAAEVHREPSPPELDAIPEPEIQLEETQPPIPELKIPEAAAEVAGEASDELPTSLIVEEPEAPHAESSEGEANDIDALLEEMESGPQGDDFDESEPEIVEEHSTRSGRPNEPG
jgi:hypothetical protein